MARKRTAGSSPAGATNAAVAERHTRQLEELVRKGEGSSPSGGTKARNASEIAVHARITRLGTFGEVAQRREHRAVNAAP